MYKILPCESVARCENESDNSLPERENPVVMIYDISLQRNRLINVIN